VLSGARVRRDVDGVQFDTDIDPNVARVATSLKFGAATSGILTLTPQSPVSRIDLQAGSARVMGSLMTRFCAPPSASSLQADLVVSAGPPATVASAGNAQEPTSDFVYCGDLLTWDNPEALVIQRFTTYATPTLHLDVDLTDSTAGDAAARRPDQGNPIRRRRRVAAVRIRRGSRELELAIGAPAELFDPAHSRAAGHATRRSVREQCACGKLR